MHISVMGDMSTDTGMVSVREYETDAGDTRAALAPSVTVSVDNAALGTDSSLSSPSRLPKEAEEDEARGRTEFEPVRKLAEEIPMGSRSSSSEVSISRCSSLTPSATAESVSSS